MSGPAVETVLNNAVEDDFRSTSHSISSLVLRLGGAVSAFGLALLVRAYGIPVGWVSAGLLMVGFGLVGLMTPRVQRD